MEIDSHIGCAMSGLTADARTMIDHARVECQSHRFNYDEPVGVEAITQAVCDLALRFGEDRKGKEDVMVLIHKLRQITNFTFLESTFWCCTFSCWN
jgi:20S proteasome subunit alpha 5